MIDYRYLRDNKASILKELHDLPLLVEAELKNKVYKNATILPLKKFNHDKMCWGRGGLVDSEKNMFRIQE